MFKFPSSDSSFSLMRKTDGLSQRTSRSGLKRQSCLGSNSKKRTDSPFNLTRSPNHVSYLASSYRGSKLAHKASRSSPWGDPPSKGGPSDSSIQHNFILSQLMKEAQDFKSKTMQSLKDIKYWEALKQSCKGQPFGSHLSKEKGISGKGKEPKEKNLSSKVKIVDLKSNISVRSSFNGTKKSVLSGTRSPSKESTGSREKSADKKPLSIETSSQKALSFKYFKLNASSLSKRNVLSKGHSRDSSKGNLRAARVKFNIQENNLLSKESSKILSKSRTHHQSERMIHNYLGSQQSLNSKENKIKIGRPLSGRLPINHKRVPSSGIVSFSSRSRPQSSTTYLGQSQSTTLLNKKKTEKPTKDDCHISIEKLKGQSQSFSGRSTFCLRQTSNKDTSQEIFVEKGVKKPILKKQGDDPSSDSAEKKKNDGKIGFLGKSAFKNQYILVRENTSASQSERTRLHNFFLNNYISGLRLNFFDNESKYKDLQETRT